MGTVMNLSKELKDKWIEALESGEYTQTIRKLKKENKHCCLGVLCELIPDINVEASQSAYTKLEKLLGENVVEKI
jgi:hypothetical protein